MSRLETLSDGVFAIAMTLLVLDLKVPGAAEPVLRAITTQWPVFVSYVLSFVILGIFWIGQHFMFAHLHRSDRRHTWITILFLMSMAFVPFSAAVLGTHPRDQGAVAFYGANMTVGWLLLLLTWWYATTHHRLVDPTIDPRLVRVTLRLLLLAPLLYPLGIALSFVQVTISLAVYALVPLVYLAAHPDRYWTHDDRHACDD